METAVTFPGLAAIVPSVRKFVRGILADSPCAEDRVGADRGLRHRQRGMERTTRC
ncbi:MAG: hypothetical protein ACREP9_14940 [Candidatus Dormibacteraceae bacterium]